MDEPKESGVKILFRFYNTVLEETTVETLWATPVDVGQGYYKLDNIPFYVPGVACGDILHAVYDEDEKIITYRSTVEYSGNSNIQVIIANEGESINGIRDIFKEMGCESESLNDHYFSLEVPCALNYQSIKQKLVELENLGVIHYAEPCLSPQHEYRKD